MKFGKAHSLEGIDFSLPPDDPLTARVLGGQPAPGGFQAYLGCPMWGNKAWAGILFPPKTPARDYLSWYSRSFNTIELNTTHYRSPSPELVASWREQAAEGFRFCPKIPQVISHYRKLAGAHEETLRFAESIRHFSSKLGCSFVQMHDSFAPDLAGNLYEFLRGWPQDLPLAVEFRHEGWFSGQRLRPEAWELLREFGAGAVITDVAGRRDVLHASLSSPVAVIRFVGNGLHPSDYRRADDWVARLGDWKARGLEKVYFFVHQPDDTAAPEIGAYVAARMNEALGTSLPPPGIASGTQGQMSLF
jgi:uncharacterized protein YecE (DUF72 family)